MSLNNGFYWPYLSTQVNEVGIRVVQWEHDAVGGVQLDHDDWVIQVTGSS